MPVFSWNKELKTQFCISLASLILVMPVFSWNKEFKTRFCTLFPPGLKMFYFIPFWSFYPLFTSSYEQIKGSNKHENNKQLENMFFKNRGKKNLLSVSGTYFSRWEFQFPWAKSCSKGESSWDWRWELKGSRFRLWDLKRRDSNSGNEKEEIEAHPFLGIMGSACFWRASQNKNSDSSSKLRFKFSYRFLIKVIFS